MTNEQPVLMGFPAPKTAQGATVASLSLCISHVGLMQIRNSITETPTQAPLFGEFIDFLAQADRIHRTDVGDLWFFRSVEVPYTMIRGWLVRAEPEEYRMLVVAISDPMSMSKDLGKWDPNPWNARRNVGISVDPGSDTDLMLRNKHRRDEILVKAAAATCDHLKVTYDSDQVEITEAGAWVPVKIFVSNADLERE